MEKQSITLSLLKVKLIAVRWRTSVSGLLTQRLERLDKPEDACARAQRRHLAWLEHGADLGTAGQVSVGRDEHHERAQFMVRSSSSIPPASQARGGL